MGARFYFFLVFFFLPKVLLAEEFINHSDSQFRHDYTPMSARLGLSVGDSANGPVRYNTQFPEVKEDGRPASYYHSQAFMGVEAEWSSRWGGALLGYLIRHDLWHRQIEFRSTTADDRIWIVEYFRFKGQGFVLGWVLGDRYRESPWSVDFSLIQDLVTLNTRLRSEQDLTDHSVDLQLYAASLRTRFQFHLNSRQVGGFSFGPEIHFPLGQRFIKVKEDDGVPWVKDALQLRGSAALGASLVAQVRI